MPLYRVHGTASRNTELYGGEKNGRRKCAGEEGGAGMSGQQGIYLIGSLIVLFLIFNTYIYLE